VLWGITSVAALASGYGSQVLELKAVREADEQRGIGVGLTALAARSDGHTRAATKVVPQRG